MVGRGFWERLGSADPWHFLGCDSDLLYAVLTPDPRESVDCRIVWGYADSVESCRPLARAAMAWIRRLDPAVPVDADFTSLIRNPERPFRSLCHGRPPRGKLADSE